jgi:hypothetical protein
MRSLRLLPLLSLAACAPRAVLGHGATHASPPPHVGGPPGASVLDAPISGEHLLEPPITVVSAAGAGAPELEQPSGIVISRLPAPHRVAAAEAPLPRTVADALARAGHRDSRESLAFALAVASALTARPAPALADGPAPVDWARSRAAFDSTLARLAPRDLVVFDRAAARAPASLVGVALASDDRGVTSFIYLARGVVRIGHFDLMRPRVARDREGRTVNSYLRHTTDYPPAGTRYLAGELLAGSIRLSSRL